MKIRRVDWYADEWLSGVSSLTPEERGVYDTIINMIYSNGGPITISPDWPHLFRCHGNKLKAIIERLEKRGKIIRNGLEISQKRARNELEKAQIRVGKALENGQKGGRPPKENNDLAKPGGFSDEKLTSTTTSTSTSTEVIESITSETRARRASLSDDFDEWWSSYPHKVGKEAARKAYAKARKLTDQSSLLAGITRYQRTKPPDHSWCNPSTWLNQGRWQDEPAATEALECNSNGFRYHQSPATNLAEGFYRAARAYSEGSLQFAESLLDGERPGGDQGSSGRGLAGRPH